MKKLFKFINLLAILAICIAIFNVTEVKAGEYSKSVTIKFVKNHEDGIIIKWKKISKASGYIIYKKTNDGKLEEFDKVSKTTNYIDEDVETGVTYSYAIKAYTKKKDRIKNYKISAVSREVIGKPLSPKSVELAKSTKKYVKLKWVENPYATGYKIYRTADEKNWELIHTSDENITSYKDTTIEKGIEYKYKVNSYEIVNGVLYDGLDNDNTIATVRLKGIDVSYHNGKINWEKVKASGVDYAMIRIGYGDDKKGGILDRRFKYNMKHAKKVGMKVGVYFYSYADNVKEAKKEAKFVVKQLKKYDIDYPVAFDFENDYRRKKKYKKANTEIVKAFCDYINKAGYEAILYSDSNYIRDFLKTKQVSKYGLWVARWTYDKNDYRDTDLKNVFMWQYSDYGKIKGIDERVDLNVGFIYR